MNDINKLRLLFLAFSLLFILPSESKAGCAVTVSFTGDTVLCAGASINYKTKKEANVTYAWTAIGGKIISGQGTDSVMVLWLYGGRGMIKLKKTSSSLSCADSLQHIVLIGASDGSINDKSAYTLKGNASRTKSGDYYITDGNGNENSAIWNRNLISLENSFDFTFNVNQCGGSSGAADGMMFILQNTDTSAMGGSTSQGSAMAYYDAASGVMDQSLGIELDIYQSTTATWADSSDSHIALVKNKSVTPLVKQVNISPKLQSCSTEKFRVIWNAQNRQLTVYYAGKKILSYTNNIVNTIFNGNPFVYFGFTGATGGVTSTQYFSNDTLIYAKPFISSNKSLVFCENDSVTLTASTGSAYTWSTGAHTSQIVVKKTGNYNVTVTDLAGCTRTSDSVYLQVSPLPSFDLGPDVHTCQGSPVSIGVSANTQYAYYLYTRDGSYASTKSQDFVNPDSTKWFYMNVRDRKTNCSSTDSIKVIVDAGPIVGFTAPDACLGFPSVFTNTSKGKLSYVWDFGDGTKSTSKTPTKTYSTAGSYRVVLTAKNDSSGCTDSFVSKVRVIQRPVAGFNITDVCEGSSINFYNTSNAGIGPIKTLTWDFGDGTTSTLLNPVKKYSDPGTYTVKVTVENNYGCKDSITKSVTIFPKPKADFSYVGACANSAVLFFDSSTIDTPYVIKSYSWDFGDGSTSKIATPDHAYKKAGAYSVRLIVDNNKGCVDTVIKTVTVAALPKAQFTVADICFGQPVSPVNASTADTPTHITAWHWHMGDGKSYNTEKPKHNYTAAGQYTIWLTVTTDAGCKDSTSKTITVNPLPDAGFTSHVSGITKRVTFTPNDTNLVSYAWDLGDGTTSTQKKPVKLYATDKQYVITLTVTSAAGCTNTSSDTIDSNVGIDLLMEVENGIKVYPNPFTNEFTVTYTLTRRSDVVMTLTDMNGKELLRKTDLRQRSGENTISLKTAGLKPGVYMLKVSTDEGVFTRKVMKM